MNTSLTERNHVIKLFLSKQFTELSQETLDLTDPLVAQLYIQSLNQIGEWKDEYKRVLGLYDTVPVDIITLGALLFCKEREFQTAKQMVEEWMGQLSDLEYENVDYQGYLRLVELYVVHCLGQLDDHENALGFIQVDTKLKKEDKALLMQKLDTPEDNMTDKAFDEPEVIPEDIPEDFQDTEEIVQPSQEIEPKIPSDKEAIAPILAEFKKRVLTLQKLWLSVQSWASQVYKNPRLLLKSKSFGFLGLVLFVIGLRRFLVKRSLQ